MFSYLSLKSGTDIRGVASEGGGAPVNLTDEVIERITDGFLVWMERHTGQAARGLTVAVGHDSRISADRISAAVCRTLVSRGVTVHDTGLSSTPSMFMATLELPVDASIQITASHHPFFRNGLKFFTPAGGLDAPDITEILESAQEGAAPAPAEGGNIRKTDFMRRYAADLREIIKAGVSAQDRDLPLLGFHILVDAGNGAGGFYASEVLAPLGADVAGSQFLDPDGRFPNHIPNPENEEAMASISGAVRKNGAELGVIFDTDVDRAGCVDSTGREINRNRLVAMAAAVALEDAPGGTIVTDSITSDGLKTYIEETLGGKHHRFKRGYKNVINEAIRLNEAGVDCPLAIETSGHAALRENHFLDDGAYLVTKLIIKMARQKKEGKTLDSLIASLKEPAEEKELRFSILCEDFRPAGEAVIAALEQYSREYGWKIAPDNREGLHVSFPQGDGDGWFLLRLSVHDPILPLNMESNAAGGVRVIAQKLLTFFEAERFPDIDTSPLESFLRT